MVQYHNLLLRFVKLKAIQVKTSHVFYCLWIAEIFNLWKTQEYNLLVTSDPLKDGQLDDAVVPASVGPQHERPSQTGGHRDPVCNSE